MADITPHPAGTSFFTVVRHFLLDHERLLLGIIGALVIWVAVGKVQDIISRHDQSNLTIAQASLTAQQDANKKTEEIVAQQKAAYDALEAKLNARDAALTQAQVTLANALAKQQRTDSQMTDPELASRWNTLVPEATVSITNGQATLPDAGAHATVNELEKVPVLEDQLANETQLFTNTNVLLSSANERVVTLNGLVDGKNFELKKADLVCEDKIKTVKDAARKSKRRWFIIGYIAGFASRQAIKTYLGF